jgi:DNA-binding SARP family transcriptional activator
MLFLRPTLLGPPDIRLTVPLLLFARDNGLEAAFAEDLLATLDLTDLTLHPGYQLRVQTLGPLRLWLGTEEVSHRAWQRKKALQLFLLFLAHHGQVLHREQICDLLWPEMEPDDAVRDFKIAYSAMLNVLEPERKRHAPSAFILRKDVRYGLRPEADLWLDAVEFEDLVHQGDRQIQNNPASAIKCYQEALVLYGGNYLQAYPYYDWCTAEQERLLILYLHASERVAQALVDSEAWGEAVQVCQSILAHDSCWEGAYRLLMTAYDKQGNRAQALQTYERCRLALHDRWGVEPMPETTALYQSIKQTPS